MKSLMFTASLAALALGTGCLRSYNTTPLSPVSLNKVAKVDPGLVLQTKAFLTKAEIMDKFGTKLAEDRQVVPVQVSLANKGTDSYRVLRAEIALVGVASGKRVPSLAPEQIYQLGRHGYGAPVCGLIFGGPLGVPSLVTTIVSNNRLRDDYQVKSLQDALLEPSKEVTGAVFFDLVPQGLTRDEAFKLVVDLQNAATGAKLTIEQPLN